jgi:transglutaminase-like putative cysteine protease
VSLGAFPIVAVAVSRAEATAAHGSVEMMTSTFVKPDRKIEGARELKRATYVLSVPEGKLPGVPTAGGQVFETLGERDGRLTVECGRSSAATDAEAGSETFIKPSQTIDWEDEKVKELVKRATEGLGRGKPAKRAEAMRLFVHRYINKKSLGVGFASASEVARTREGDCTEHGVLLAALLRADGIPSRVVCGLVYADQFAGAQDIFGYHMWTQALLEVDGQKRWVDLDATLSPDQPFDATHIALATSALADGDSQDALLSIAMIIGRLGVRVEATE